MRRRSRLPLALVLALAGCGSVPEDRALTDAPRRHVPLTPFDGAVPPTASQVVNAIQIGLTRLGYYTGPIDGRTGPRTARAIRAYQRDRGLVENGRATPQLADHLWSVGRLPARGSSAGASASAAGQG